MFRPLLLIGILAVAASAAEPDCPHHEKRTVVPLEQIWSLDMPGTRRIQELEPEAFGSEARASVSVNTAIERIRNSKIAKIREQLLREESSEDLPQKSFLVSGTGEAALATAYQVLLGQEDEQEEFPAGESLSVIFFAKSSPRYIRLEEVSIIDEKIDLQYRVVPHLADEVTVHLAIIPLPQLPAGKYRVSATRLPMPAKYTQLGYTPLSDSEAGHLISGPSRFEILAE